MTDILHLKSLRVTKVAEGEYDYIIVAEVKTPLTSCPHCNSKNIKKHGSRDATFMDTPIHTKRTGIRLVHQRYYCKDCKKSFSDPLPDLDENHFMTKRLVEFIQKQAFKRTFVSIAEEIGITEGTVRLIFNDHAKELEKQYALDTPRWLGIDELKVCGKARCVLTSPEKKSLLDMLKTRSKTVVTRWLLGIPGRSRVELVTMDMWNPYRDAVQAVLPDAKIVVDRFHIQKMANTALEDARKAIRAGLTSSERRKLMHERFLLLRREKNLDMTDRILRDSWFNELPLLEKAYLFKEAYFDIWELKTRKEAEEQYDKWKEVIPDELRPYFKPVFTAMENWHTEIFNYFDNRVTNAYTETINGLIKLDNRIGRGYDFETIRARMLFGPGRNVKRPAFGSDIMFDLIRPIPDNIREQYQFTHFDFTDGVDIEMMMRYFPFDEFPSKQP